MSKAESSDARVVLMTAPDVDQAEALARAIVGERLAACVNLLPGARSVYRWEGAVEMSSEVLMIAKTSADQLHALEERVAELHPYEVPEFVALDPTHVAPKYLAWLVEATL